MEALLIDIMATVLYVNAFISLSVYLGVIVASLIWMFVGASLYFKFGFLKIWYHDVLGWCTPDDSPQYSDGCSIHAKCKHCGRDIMQDSQGNWF